MTRLFLMPDSLAEGRPLLNVEVPSTRRKNLGQFFTGLRTGRLLSALAVHHKTMRIIDPMAGHGDLLESVAKRAHLLDMHPNELVGIEIEGEAAKLGEWRVEQCVKEYGIQCGYFIHGDAFDTKNWKETCQFDLVITNPPYVRYQTLSNGRQEGGVKLLSTEATRRALQLIATKLAPPEEHAIWHHLIHSYSGLSDLSVPSWLLCGLLTAPDGILALIVPQTWLNRDYARIARYFFLRFFHPLAIVQESGQRWFRDALVPVSLVVGRRLSTEQVIMPLRDRTFKIDDTPFSEIGPAAASARSHVGNAFKGDDPEAEFAEWLKHGTDLRRGLNLKRVEWETQRDEVFAASYGAEWLRRLEGDSRTPIAIASASNTFAASISHHIPTELLKNVRPLSLEPICVGQGLRTGCNPFFYVDVETEGPDKHSVVVRTSELFGKRRIQLPVSALKPVLRRQNELSTIQIVPKALCGRMLDLRGFVLPENAPRNGGARSAGWQVMPESLAVYVRLAGHTDLPRGNNRTPIPRLSAVRPNGLGPNEANNLSLSPLGNVPRMWYMVPDFAPRHLPSLCVPRIIHDAPNAILNADPPVLIDANFSTLWCQDDRWNAKHIFAILNSTWGELCMESLGATLGGGALKLEATHLRQLPIPVLSDSQKESLSKIVSEAIDSKCLVNEFRNQRTKVDRLIIAALLRRRVSVSEAQTYIKKLEAVSRFLRAKRRRTCVHAVLDE